MECKNKFSRWDKAKIQGQLQDYVRFEKAYSDKKIVAILAETDGDEVWVWFGQSVIIDDEHRMEEETVLRTFEEYENLCFGRVNDKIKVVDSIKTLNEKLHTMDFSKIRYAQKSKSGVVYKNLDVFAKENADNQYQFETYAPMITGRTPIPNGKQTSYERNRNLFYVCCSRPRKRLFFFVSVPIDASFRVFLDDLVGAENIYTYGQYLEAKQ